MGTMPIGPQMQPEPENKYAKLYDKLKSISPKFAVMTNYLNRNQWVVFNHLRDEEKELGQIASIMKVPVSVLELAEHPRRCYFKWDDDVEKVKDCIAGKIDP